MSTVRPVCGNRRVLGPTAKLRKIFRLIDLMAFFSRIRMCGLLSG